MSQLTDLDELTRAVAHISPQLADVWEATAIIESLGYTDRAIQQDFGFANALALGECIYQRISGNPVIKTPQTTPAGYQWLIKELRIFVEQFFRSFIYALPWLTLFILDYVKPASAASLLPPEVAAPLSLAVMGSLITSGGFIQVIARRGQFYLNLAEPLLARRVCAQFLRAGLVVTTIIAFIALLFGFYRSLFADEYLILAAGYYLLLSLLWMLCAMLTIQPQPWRVPAIFISSGLLFLVLKNLVGLNALPAQLTATIVSVIAAIIAAWRGFHTKNQGKDIDVMEMELPRVPALVISLIPYFSYGICYFSFLFADRLTAGSAVSLVTGLNFALDAAYQRGMDLALVNFLVIAALIEYFNYKFMHYWYGQAELVTAEDIEKFSRQLRRRYLVALIWIVKLFLITGIITGWLFANLIDNEMVWRTWFIGLLGYLILSIGLLNSMILFSLARPIAVLQALVPGLLLNLIAGYLLSHLLGAQYAALGLVLGATVMAIHSSISIQRVLKQPDYAFFAA